MLVSPAKLLGPPAGRIIAVADGATTVKVAVVVPAGTGEGVTEQLGIGAGPATVQLNCTALANPFFGATVITSVTWLPRATVNCGFATVKLKSTSVELIV
jgi:hypothetical protein